MPDRNRAGNRRMIGFVMAGSAGLMVLVASLVLTGAIPVAESSRTLVGSVLAAAGVIDLILAGYFIVSDPS